MILDSNLNISHELITMLAEKTNHYYALLEAHNKATEEMKKSQNVSKHILCISVILFYKLRTNF